MWGSLVVLLDCTHAPWLHFICTFHQHSALSFLFAFTHYIVAPFNKELEANHFRADNMLIPLESSTGNDGHWKTEQILNEEAIGMGWTEKEIVAEGEFNLYERQSLETPSPASSPCINLPITPSFSRSSISSDSSSRHSLFLQSPKSSLSSMSSPCPRQLRQFPESMNAQCIFQRIGVQDLPNELLYEIFEYAVDERCVYDYLVETDNAPDDLLLRDIFPITGDDGRAKFIRVRVETQLSRVCSLWRGILRTRDVVCIFLPFNLYYLNKSSYYYML